MDRLEAKETKKENRRFKEAERARRDARMTQRLKGGCLPYAPAVMSWLSRKLDKKAHRITSEDVKAILQTTP
jgi:hypothetical protein